MENSLQTKLILKLDEQGEPCLDEKILDDSLLHQEYIADANAVIIATVGLGKGKSLLMNFFQLFLSKGDQSGDFDDDTSLMERSWNPSGSEGNTPGIRMFSKLLPATSPNEEKTMLIFLDTEGTTEEENSTIFALSTALSSVLIYNLAQNITEYNLQQLEKFSEIARNLSYDTGHKPFQKLLFLIRDWYRVLEADYGSVGGQTYAEKKLKIGQNHPEGEFVRNHIKACFANISCFLTPYPGSKVTSPKFEGKLSDMEADFKNAMKQLIQDLLDPKNRVLKEIGREKITVRRWVSHFKSSVLVMKNEIILPEPALNTQAIEVDILMGAFATAKETFHQNMEANFSKTFDTHKLKEEFPKWKQQAVHKFLECVQKIGEQSILSVKYRNRLVQDMEDYHDFLRNLCIDRVTPETTPNATECKTNTKMEKKDLENDMSESLPLRNRHPHFSRAIDELVTHLGQQLKRTRQKKKDAMSGKDTQI